MPGRRDWTPEQLALIDSSYDLWKEIHKKSSRGRHVIPQVVVDLAQESVLRPDGESFEEWEAHRWPQEIGKYYHDRLAAETGRPRAQRKTPEQIAILERVFRKTCAYPYTGEALAASFLTGLEPRQVTSWFERQRTKLDDYELDNGFECQDPTAARRMRRTYQLDPEAFVRGVIFGEINPRTGNRRAERKRPRVSLVKTWKAWERAREAEDGGAQDHEGAEAGPWNENDDSDEIDEWSRLVPLDYAAHRRAFEGPMAVFDQSD